MIWAEWRIFARLALLLLSMFAKHPYLDGNRRRAILGIAANH